MNYCNNNNIWFKIAIKFISVKYNIILKDKNIDCI